MTHPAPLIERLRGLLEKATPGPWELCQHLKGIEEDRACRCGYRGVVFGPEHEGYAVFQPGHEPARKGQEGTEPPRYPREIEIANSQLIVETINALPTLLALIERLAKEREEAEAKVEHLMHVIDRDRYIVAHGTTAVESECRAREWLLTGRGPYEWDDDDYRKEFGDALNAIRAGLEPLRKVAWDKSDCTRIDERVNAAKLAASELLKQPLGNREMLSADLFGHPAEAQAAAAEKAGERWRVALERIASEHIKDEQLPNGHVYHADCDACHRQEIARQALGGGE